MASARLLIVIVCVELVPPVAVEGNCKLSGDTFISGVSVKLIAIMVRSMLPVAVHETLTPCAAGMPITVRQGHCVAVKFAVYLDPALTEHEGFGAGELPPPEEVWHVRVDAPDEICGVENTQLPAGAPVSGVSLKAGFAGPSAATAAAVGRNTSVDGSPAVRMTLVVPVPERTGGKLTPGQPVVLVVAVLAPGAGMGSLTNWLVEAIQVERVLGMVTEES